MTETHVSSKIKTTNKETVLSQFHFPESERKITEKNKKNFEAFWIRQNSETFSSSVNVSMRTVHRYQKQFFAENKPDSSTDTYLSTVFPPFVDNNRDCRYCGC